MADAAAASNPWLPAASSSLWYTTASAEGVSPSSRARTALVLADSRSSSVKPPAWRGSPARGANGTAASRTAAQAAITHHRRRYTNAPSRSNGVTGATGGLRCRKCMRTRQGPSYRLRTLGPAAPYRPVIGTSWPAAIIQARWAVLRGPRRDRAGPRGARRPAGRVSDAARAASRAPRPER